jgi:WD40 repeat protein
MMGTLATNGIVVIDLTHAREPLRLSTKSAEIVSSIAISPNNKTLAAIHESGHIEVYDLDQMTLLHEGELSTNFSSFDFDANGLAVKPKLSISCVCISHDSKLLAAGSSMGNKVFLYDLVNGKVIQAEDRKGLIHTCVPNDTEDLHVHNTVCFNGDSTRLAVVGLSVDADDGFVFVVDSRTLKEHYRILRKSSLLAATFGRNTNYFACGGTGMSIGLYDACSGSHFRDIPRDSVLTDLAFSHDVRTIPSSSLCLP